MLEVKNIGTFFGSLKAVDSFSFTLKEDGLSDPIGPNGAGKTTISNFLTGVHRPDKGNIRPDGGELTGKSVIEISQAGIARTSQNIQLFSNLSVLNNVKAGLHNHHPYTALEGIFRLPRFHAQEKEMNRRATGLLEVFHLEQFTDTRTENLPYGSQWKLKIARTSTIEPKLLLLNGPMAGMNPNETAGLMETIQLVQRRFHMTILLIEHDMKLVSDIYEHLTVLNFGKVLRQGETQGMLHDPKVTKAYLGE